MTIKLDKKDEQYLRNVKKHSRVSLWPSIGAFLSGAWVALFHKDKFGPEGLITIEILFLLLIVLGLAMRRTTRKLLSIIDKITEP